MSEDDTDKKSLFRVKTLTGRTVDLSFDTVTDALIRRLLDGTSPVVVCPDCGDLTLVTDRTSKQEILRCGHCDDPMVGVIDVTEIEEANDAS